MLEILLARASVLARVSLSRDASLLIRRSARADPAGPAAGPASLCPAVPGDRVPVAPQRAGRLAVACGVAASRLAGPARARPGYPAIAATPPDRLAGAHSNMALQAAHHLAGAPARGRLRAAEGAPALGPGAHEQSPCPGAETP